MRNALITAAILVAIALGSGVVGYHASYDRTLHQAARQGDIAGWLKREYRLTDQQYAAIAKLHNDYASSCDEHCRLIREAARTRDELRARLPAGAPALAEAEQRIRTLRADCEQSLSRHLEQVAALMSPEDGRRYLDTMLPLVAAFDHSGAPALDFSKSKPGHGH